MDVRRLDGLEDAPGRADVVGMVGIDHQLGTASDGLAHLMDIGDVLFHAKPDLEFHGREAVGQVPARFLDGRLGAVVVPKPPYMVLCLLSLRLPADM